MLNIYRFAIIAYGIGVDNPLITNDSKRFVSWCNQAARHARDNAIAVFNAAYREIWRHSVDGDTFVRQLAGRKGGYGFSRTEECRQPSEHIPRMDIRASNFELVFRWPRHAAVVDPSPRS